MTKLSFVGDHEMRCRMFSSSSILGSASMVSTVAKTAGTTASVGAARLTTHLYSLWIKAVCTTFGTVAEPAGAAMAEPFVFAFVGADSVVGEVLFCSEVPLKSLSGLLLERAAAFEFVGVLTSMGSLGDGADIWMVGVMMGRVRGVSESARSAARDRCGLPVMVAMGTTRTDMAGQSRARAAECTRWQRQRRRGWPKRWTRGVASFMKSRWGASVVAEGDK
jgi:hypothetical protein